MAAPIKSQVARIYFGVGCGLGEFGGFVVVVAPSGLPGLVVAGDA
jgi:hypothetical protein